MALRSLRCCLRFSRLAFDLDVGTTICFGHSKITFRKCLAASFIPEGWHLPFFIHSCAIRDNLCWYSTLLRSRSCSGVNQGAVIVYTWDNSAIGACMKKAEMLLATA